ASVGAGQIRGLSKRRGRKLSGWEISSDRSHPTRYCPFGENSIRVTGSLMVNNSFQDPTCQSINRATQELARVRSSAEKLTDQTPCTCPWRVSARLPVSRSQM